MLHHRLHQTAELYRLSNDDNAETQTFDFLSNIGVYIYPLSEKEIALYDGNFSKSFGGRCGALTDIREGDRIKWTDGKHYDVNGVKTHNFGNLAHKRLLLEMEADQGQE